MGSWEALYLAQVDVSRLTSGWPGLVNRPKTGAVRVRASRSGDWLELVGPVRDELASELSQQLSSTAVLFRATSSVGLVWVTVWRDGRRVRDLLHAEGAWKVVEGDPQPWERVLTAPPRVGATDHQLQQSQGEDLLHALGVRDVDGAPRELPAAPSDDRWVVAALVGVPVLGIGLIYALLRLSGAPGG